MLKFLKSQYQNFIFPLNYTRYEKKLFYKIIFYMKIYTFEMQHFFIRFIFFFLIQKNTIENPKFNFFDNNMWNAKKT